MNTLTEQQKEALRNLYRDGMSISQDVLNCLWRDGVNLQPVNLLDISVMRDQAQRCLSNLALLEDSLKS